MANTALASLFEEPVISRDRVIGAIQYTAPDLPERGSSFFIHLSELCPVACKHCMYSSDLNPKSAKDSLSDPELERAIDFINDSKSEKLTISGGGEPFLKFSSILRLLAQVKVPRIEIVTAGYWAKTEARAARLLTRIDDALTRNPNNPEALLRLSIDRYHINAPRPVRIEHYANVVQAWRRLSVRFALGFRGIQPDMGTVDRQLADSIGARVEVVNAWNRRIVLADGCVLPITFNVLRKSGKAAQLQADLIGHTQTIREYYSPFESGANRLTLATAVNDAIGGSYTVSLGVAVTMNSDGTFWIFCGTAPDRRLFFDGQSFAEAVAYFFQDPITHLLVKEGVWYLAEVVSRLDPATHVAAVAKNDVASFVEDLLASADVRLATTLIAARQMVADGGAVVRRDRQVAHVLESENDLLASCAEALQKGRY